MLEERLTHGRITAEKKFEAEVNIVSYQVDERQLLRPSAFMDLAQEMAYRTSSAMHFGFDDLRRSSFVWVLTRMQIRFLRRPRWNERVRFATWCKRAVSVFFLRDFQMTDVEGQPLVEATTSWTVINAETRRMVRGEDVQGIVSDEWLCADSVFDSPAEKVVVPADLEQKIVAERRVAYADIDVVGHTNNTRYVVWAMDCMDYDYLIAHDLREITINFNHECRPGQVVSLFRANDGDRWWVTGQVDNRQVFAVEMVFQKAQ